MKLLFTLTIFLCFLTIESCIGQENSEFDAKQDKQVVVGSSEQSPQEETPKTKVIMPGNITGSYLTCSPFAVDADILIQCSIDKDYMASKEILVKVSMIDINVFSVDDTLAFSVSKELVSDSFSVIVPSSSFVVGQNVYVTVNFPDDISQDFESNEMKLPLSQLVLDPPKIRKEESCSDKGGVEIFDSCLFYGALGQSCSDVCNDSQLTYSEKTRNVIGSSGSNANCALVLNLLGVDNIPGANYLLIGSNGISNAVLSNSNVGCYFKPDEGVLTGRYRNTSATSADASANNSRRACLCE